MKTIKTKFSLIIRLTFLAAAMVLTGCASMEGKFTETTVANLPVFADQTLALMGGEDPGLYLNETVFIREYLTGEDPNEILIDELVVTADKLLVAIADYSLDLALVADTVSDPEAQKARYMENLIKLERVVTQELNLQELNLHSNVEAAAQQETLLGAMRTAQPIIDALGRHGLMLMSRHDDGVESVARHVELGIEEDYAGLYEYADWLGGHRDAVLLELGELIEQEAQGKDISRQENELIARLEVINRLATEIEPHWEIYRSAQRELDKVHLNVLNSSNRVRLILLVWVRAHERMTSGRQEDAEWFTMQELGAVAFKLGRKLI
jgi:hypothetical protein